MKLRSLHLAEADKFNTWFVVPSKPLLRDAVDWICNCGEELFCTGFFLYHKGMAKELCECGVIYKVTSRDRDRVCYRVWRY